MIGFVVTIVQAQQIQLDFEIISTFHELEFIQVSNFNGNSTVRITPSDKLLLSNALREHYRQGLSVYPNPVVDQGSVRFHIENSGEVKILLHSITGQQVANIYTQLAAGEYECKITNLPSGVFVVSVNAPNQRQSAKFISQSFSKGSPSMFIVNSLDESDFKMADQTALKSIYFNPSDRLEITAYSGRIKTTQMIEPVFSSTILIDLTQCIDGDGNSYPTVQIDDQLWMAENLKTTSYSNGDPIVYVADNGLWRNLNSPAFCWFGNDPEIYKDIYGALYNGYAVDDSRNLCPAGWHVPTVEDWQSLQNYMSSNDISSKGGYFLRAENIWPEDSNNANFFGFEAKPSGLRYAHNGTFGHLGTHARWWTSTSLSDRQAWNRYINFDKGYLGRGNYDKRYGYSIRCVKD